MKGLIEVKGAQVLVLIITKYNTFFPEINCCSSHR